MFALLAEPHYGVSSWHVGFLDIHAPDYRLPDGTIRPNPVGLEAFREARRRCIAHVAALAGPEYPIKVHRVVYRRHKMPNRKEPAIEMTVFTVTTHRIIGTEDT